MVKITAISDTHLREIDLPGGDLLIHAGDALLGGSRQEMEKFVPWFNDQKTKYTHSVFVPGNHDWFIFQNQDESRDMLKGTCMLLDQEIKLFGLRIFGSPWSRKIPMSQKWAWPLYENIPGQAEEKWKRIPEGLDILITHTPPVGVLDEHWCTGAKLGDVHLRDRVCALQHPPRYHLFGHIHEYGHQSEKFDMIKLPDGHINSTDCRNLAICDEQYDPTNPITLLEISP